MLIYCFVSHYTSSGVICVCRDATVGLRAKGNADDVATAVAAGKFARNAGLAAEE